MPVKIVIVSGVAAFGLALFGFGKIVEEPPRRASALEDRHASTPPGGGRGPALKWELWKAFDEPPSRAPEPPPETNAGIWAAPAEWAPSD